IIAAHRDISPTNVMVSSEGEVKVADFGIARLEAPSQATDPGMFKGKFAYSAPEVLMGDAASPASDQFALGLVLYEMLAGQHPFGVHEDALAYARLIPTQEPPKLEVASPHLREIVQQMLAKDPAKRFSTPEACGHALAEFLAR